MAVDLILGEPVRKSRGDAAGREWPVGAIAVVCASLAALAVGVIVALFPHRVDRSLGEGLYAVRVWNAFSGRCQLENVSDSAPLPYTCGSSLASVHVARDARRRRLVAVRSEHDNCIVDADTLEAVLCRDTMLEWALVERERATLAILDPRGRGVLAVQRDFATGETRELVLPYSQWIRTTGDPDRPLVIVEGEDREFRLGFGALEPLEGDH